VILPLTARLFGWQVGTLNYMSPEAILGGATNIRGGPPMKVQHLFQPQFHCILPSFPCRLLLPRSRTHAY